MKKQAWSAPYITEIEVKVTENVITKVGGVSDGLAPERTGNIIFS